MYFCLTLKTCNCVITKDKLIFLKFFIIYVALCQVSFKIFFYTFESSYISPYFCYMLLELAARRDKI